MKSQEDETQKSQQASESLSFPVHSFQNTTPKETGIPANQSSNDDSISEVLQVYENGLDSINMPGYDFFEFYKAITSIGTANEQAYTMAFQMAKSMDKTITPRKLLTDAEFYISKINEVHSQYVMKGQQKLSSIQEHKSAERTQLNTEVDQGTMRLAQIRAEMQQLESALDAKRKALAKVDETYHDQEQSIREKLNANDMAKSISVGKLNSIKDGIERFIQDK